MFIKKTTLTFITILVLVIIYFLLVYIPDSPFRKLFPNNANLSQTTPSNFEIIEFAQINPSLQNSILVTPSQVNSFNADNVDVALALEYAHSQNKSATFHYFASLEKVEAYLNKNPEIIGIALSENNFNLIEKKTLQSSHYHLSDAYRYAKQVVIANKSNKVTSDFLLDIASSPSDKLSAASTHSTPSNDFLKVNINISRSDPNLRELYALANEHPKINIMLNELPVNKLGKFLNNSSNELAHIDNSLMPVLQMLYPSIRAKFTLNITTPMVWAISNNNKLAQYKTNQINMFFEKLRSNGRMVTIAEKFYYDLSRLDNLDLQYFRKRVSSRLKPLITHFKNAANATGQSWILLAALSYQESQWVASAVSTTGARGLMMINEITAQQLKISQDDSSPTQIMAGAKYLKVLRDDLLVMDEDDRILLALAAYNAGGGALSRIIRNYLKTLPKGSANPDTDKIKTIFTGKYITTKLSPTDWQKINWADIRNFILQQSLKRRVSSQPVVLAERIRIFQSLLKNMDESGILEDNATQ